MTMNSMAVSDMSVPLPSIVKGTYLASMVMTGMAMAGVAMDHTGKNVMMCGMNVKSMAVNNVVVFVLGT